MDTRWMAIPAIHRAQNNLAGFGSMVRCLLLNRQRAQTRRPAAGFSFLIAENCLTAVRLEIILYFIEFLRREFVIGCLTAFLEINPHVGIFVNIEILAFELLIRTCFSLEAV